MCSPRCASPGGSATLPVLERTLHGLRNGGLAEVMGQEHGTADDSWAATTNAELIERAGPAGERYDAAFGLKMDAEDQRPADHKSQRRHRQWRRRCSPDPMATLTARAPVGGLTPVRWLRPGRVDVIQQLGLVKHWPRRWNGAGGSAKSLASAEAVEVTETWGYQAESLGTSTPSCGSCSVAEVGGFSGFLFFVLLSTGIQQSVSLIYYTPTRSRPRSAHDTHAEEGRTHLKTPRPARAEMGQIEDAYRPDRQGTRTDA